MKIVINTSLTSAHQRFYGVKFSYVVIISMYFLSIDISETTIDLILKLCLWVMCEIQQLMKSVQFLHLQTVH